MSHNTVFKQANNVGISHPKLCRGASVVSESWLVGTGLGMVMAEAMLQWVNDNCKGNSCLQKGIATMLLLARLAMMLLMQVSVLTLMQLPVSCGCKLK